MDILLVVFLLGLFLQGIKVSINYLLTAGNGFTETLSDTLENVNLLSAVSHKVDQRASGAVTLTASKKAKPVQSTVGQQRKLIGGKEVIIPTVFHQTA